MDQLPPEILDSILQKNIEMCRDHKSQLLDLRLVCKAFDQGLKSSIFKTTSLEFSRFIRFRNIDDNPDELKALKDIASLSSSMYIDMMITRDTGMREYPSPRPSVASHHFLCALSSLYTDRAVSFYLSARHFKANTFVR